VSQPSFDKAVDKQIIAAVDRDLEARGLKKPASRPSDLVVTYRRPVRCRSIRSARWS
jgi:hypothetical protein